MCAVICVGQLIEKAEAREKERLKEESKRQKRLENSFKNMLKQSAPPLDVGNQWDEVSLDACVGRQAVHIVSHVLPGRNACGYMHCALHVHVHVYMKVMCLGYTYCSTSNALDCACIRPV